jgi:uncharacterized protein
MTVSLPERLQQLTSRMLRKRLFVVTMTADAGPDRLMPHLADHLEYMTELARRGVLFASGPFLRADGTPTGDGFSIFNTASAEEARRFAEKDPFYSRSAKVRGERMDADGRLDDGDAEFRQRTLDVA